MRTYKAWIVNNATGEGRWSETRIEDRYVDTQQFWWTRFEGNAGCDCNRALFWSRASGEDDLEVECGHAVFSVPFLEWDDGSRTLIDERGE